MRRGVLTLVAAVACVAVAGNCKKKTEPGAAPQPAEAEVEKTPPPPVETPAEDAESAPEADAAPAEVEEEAAPEVAAAPEHKPGETPFEYPIVATTTAKEGDYVLAPSRSWIDDGFAKGGTEVTFIYYTARMVAPGEAESKVKTLPGDEETIPNSMIIPLPKDGTAAPGDIVLTWWQSGSGMQRALVVPGGTGTQPKVVYLDLDYDPTSNEPPDGGTLEADSFVKLSAEWDIGTAVAVRTDGGWDHALIVGLAEDRVLTIGFAGRMSAHAKADCIPAPVKLGVNAGDAVYTPQFGSFSQATVVKVDEAIGHVIVKYQFAGEERQEAVPFGDMLASLPAPPQ